jgi:hypothetical protein
MAQAPGTADPLGLLTSGGIIPFFALASGGNLGFLEIASPVGPNDSSTGRPLHLIFFNEVCNRGESIPLELTTNDIEVIDLGAVQNINGLIAFAGSIDGVNLVPMANPVHVRVFQASLVNDFVRILEPIAALNAEASPIQTWNPLRSGATFFSPPVGDDFMVAIYFVCPDGNVLSQTGGVFPLASGFPLAPSSPSPTAANPTAIEGIVFDDEEDFLRDIVTSCDCLTKRRLADVSSIYTDTAAAPLGTYTELRGGTVGAPQYFTGYRSIVTGGLDVWNRLSNANRFSLDGSVDPLSR